MRLKRDLRYTVDADDSSKTACFNDFQKNEHICRIKDYSRTGLSFYLEDGSLLLHIGDVIPKLRFFSNNREVHASGATIIHIQDEDKNGRVISCIGCTYIEEPMDVYSILKVDKITKLQNEFLDFVQSMAIEENLDPEFVNLTSHLHYILGGFQERLNQELEVIRQEEDALQGALLETLKELAFDALFDELNRYYDHFTSVASRFTDPKQHYIHREFFQKRLHSCLLKSKLFNRSITKPLGMLVIINDDIIYRTHSGDDLFSQVMNKDDCEGRHPGQCGRRSYLVKNSFTLFLIRIP